MSARKPLPGGSGPGVNLNGDVRCGHAFDFFSKSCIPRRSVGHSGRRDGWSQISVGLLPLDGAL